MKTGEWNETFNFDEDVTDLATAYETADNILESLSVAGEIKKNINIYLSVFKRKKRLLSGVNTKIMMNLLCVLNLPTNYSLSCVSLT